MSRNFNTPSSQAPELGPASWDYGDSPVSAGAPTSIGGSTEWMSTPAPEAPRGDWGDPAPASSEGWNTSTQPSFESTYNNQSESRIGERLRELRDKVVHGMGRRALDTVMSKLPSFKGKEAFQNTAANLYEDPMSRQNVTNGFSDVRNNFGGYREQAGQFAKSAGYETAIAGAKAAGRELMDNVGLNYEDGRFSVASKRKLGMTAFRAMRAPQLEVARLAKKSASAGFARAKQEGISQFKNAQQNFNIAAQPAITGYEEW